MDESLFFDPSAACHQIADFIEAKRIALKRDGVILGLSGGLDSAVVAYLTAMGVKKERITLLYMPDKDSKKIHREDAFRVAGELGIDLQSQPLSRILETMGVYDLIPLRFAPGRRLKEILVQFGRRMAGIDPGNLLSNRLNPPPNSLLSKGNAYVLIKHRLRMLILYYQANIHNLLVIGAANRTEYLTGTFSQWGCDQCADIMPVLHLYRSQIEDLAAYLKIPEQIRVKPADPDLIPGLDDKSKLLGSFLTADHILWGLEHGVPIELLAESYGVDQVDRLEKLYKDSRFMREVPYTISPRPSADTSPQKRGST